MIQPRSNNVFDFEMSQKLRDQYGHRERDTDPKSEQEEHTGRGPEQERATKDAPHRQHHVVHGVGVQVHPKAVPGQKPVDPCPGHPEIGKTATKEIKCQRRHRRKQEPAQQQIGQQSQPGGRKTPAHHHVDQHGDQRPKDRLPEAAPELLPHFFKAVSGIEPHSEPQGIGYQQDRRFVCPDHHADHRQQCQLQEPWELHIPLQRIADQEIHEHRRK